jgi:hypothetical protein
MPLQRLQFKPGVIREVTTLTAEGSWYDCDKIRFRFGFPEKIGGWAALSYNTFLGVARSLWNWVTLRNYNLLGVGTNLKFYVEDGGDYYDITPLREINGNTPSAGPPVVNASTISLTASGTVLTVSDSSADSLQADDFVTIAGANTIGGVDVNGEYQIVSVLSGTTYTVTLATSASGSVSNSAITIAYQINTGFASYTVGTGWGAGPWSRGTWGSGFTTGFGFQLRLWSQSNYGEDLLFSPRGGALYLWQPGSGATPAYSTRGTLISGTDVPSQINQILVSDATRITIAFGCSEYGAYGAAVFDPLLIRWTAQEDYSDWTPTATNQAGSYRLSRGSEIVGTLQTRQEILVWTDAAVYSMQYLGPPFVWGFTILADNISIVSPNAVATASGITYWMGTDKFYYYAGRVETLPCPVREYVFSDMNRDQEAQFFAGTNEGFSEIWFFYCSKNASVVDRYVIFNYLDQAWYYGTLSRTAWLDSPLRQFPQGATSNNIIVFHEAAVDDGSTNPPSPISSYIQTADFDVGDGNNYSFVTKVIPDITFNNSNMTGLSTDKPQVNFTLRPRQNPGSGYTAASSPVVESAQGYATQQTYNVQEFTQIVYTRVRGRQMAFRVESNTLGTQWQLGSPRMDIRADGRR